MGINCLAQTQKCWPHCEGHMLEEVGFVLSPSLSAALQLYPFLLQYPDEESAAIDAILAF